MRVILAPKVEFIVDRRVWAKRELLFINSIDVYAVHLCIVAVSAHSIVRSNAF